MLSRLNRTHRIGERGGVARL